MPVVLGQEDVENAMEGKVGVVLDRLYPGDGPSSLRECLYPGSLAQLISLHGSGLPAKRLPDGTKEVLRGKESVPTRPSTKPTQVDKTFVALRRAVQKLQLRAARWNAWIAE